MTGKTEAENNLKNKLIFYERNPFFNLVHFNQIFRIVIIIFRLIRHYQTEFSSAANQAEKCNYTRNLIRVSRPNSCCVVQVHTEKSFRNLIKSKPNKIVFTMHRLIWNRKRTLSVCCSKSTGKW